MIREPLLTDEDVAEAFQMPVARVQELARSGELPGLKIGRAWRFRGSTVDAWARAREGRQLVADDVQ